MTIRAATADDLAAIAAIQALSPEASQWDPTSYLSYQCLVAMDGTRVIGFLAARQIAADEREILNLAVDPGERRRGVARKLLETELQRAKNQWFLEVRASNFCAIKLYESAGFRVAGRREKYYRHPVDTGIVMKFDS
ncbi:MAG: ribosomal protein S18-alanine N-acetyltransferase [Acidobacteriota bacterium]